MGSTMGMRSTMGMWSTMGVGSTMGMGSLHLDHFPELKARFPSK